MNRVRLREVEFTPELVERLTPELAHKYRVIPVKIGDGALWLAHESWDEANSRHFELSIIFGLRIHCMLADPRDIEWALQRLYPERVERVRRHLDWIERVHSPLNEEPMNLRQWVCRTGRLIVIEGIDGTGKTTLATALAEALRARGEEVVQSFEPTKGKYGLQVRALAMEGREGTTAEQEAELFRKDREEHVRETILPALEADKTVILDRYFYSTMAYQGARGLDPMKILEANLKVAPLPNLLILLDLPVDEALERIVKKRGSAPDAFEGAVYLEMVRNVFMQIAHPNLLRLDARMTTAELVAAALKRC